MVAPRFVGVCLLVACHGTVSEPTRPVDPGIDPRIPAGVPDPGPMELRRLTHLEYERTIEAVFGTDVGDLVATFPAETPRPFELSNTYARQTISTLQADRYLAVARALGASIVADGTLRAGVLGCDPTADRAGCVSAYLDRLGRRLYRRPLDAETKARLAELEATEVDPVQGAARVVEAMVQSPRFLFRVEIGTPVAGRDAVHALDGWERASRLAFFLWSEAPDDALLDRAQAGELDTREGVAAVARSMLDDPRTREGLGTLVREWFLVDRLASARRAAPEFDADLRAAMATEVRMLAEEYMFGGGDFLGIYTSEHTYVNDRLAALYGLPAGGATFERVTLPADSARGGIAGTAAFLTGTVRGDETSSIIRGASVRHALVCDPPAPPPPGVPMLMPEEGRSLADLEDAHTANEVCASCHRAIDPIGHGLEMFDAIGRLRTTYTDGSPVREDGLIRGIEGEPSFRGARELGAIVAESELGASCAVKHVFRWALGRPEDAARYDAPTIDGAGASFAAAENDFRELVVAIATSDAFMNRRAPLP
jgi:hypothetical protein